MLTDDEFKRRQAEEMGQFNETDGDDRMGAARECMYVVHAYERMLREGKTVTPEDIIKDVKDAVLHS